MFKDEVVIKVKGGKGGDGIVAFRREKYVEYGGPAGGTGGNGGAVIFTADEGMSTLLDLAYNKHISADNGQNGMSKSQNGKNAKDTYIRVPVGTAVYDNETGLLLGDLVLHGQTLTVAKGGKGGRGNVAFATHKNPAPEICERGDLGESKELKIELKVLADVGLVGFPSV
ncbi:MAG TPA: GTPase ObgE, partial [Acholeplasmataceae bacterium]|nr:GTPase ObgE [Acholeplasmataceae bacterium]